MKLVVPFWPSYNNSQRYFVQNQVFNKTGLSYWEWMRIDSRAYSGVYFGMQVWEFHDEQAQTLFALRWS